MATNKKYYWLKLKETYFNQREIKKLRKLAGGDTYTIIYLKMQLLSLTNNGDIFYEQTEDDIYEQISLELDEEIENVKMTMAFLLKNGLIELNSEQDISLLKTKELIGIETASTIRSRRSRQEKALQCNTDATNCNTDIDIDIELDIETEIEKEK